jgi:hypothetical protein
VDFVEHNGGRSDGVFAITGVYVDLYSQWTVRAAGLGRISRVLASLAPLPIQGYPSGYFTAHPDNVLN